MKLFMTSIWSINNLEQKGMHLKVSIFLIQFLHVSKETERRCVLGRFYLWERDYVIETTWILGHYSPCGSLGVLTQTKDYNLVGFHSISMHSRYISTTERILFKISSRRQQGWTFARSPKTSEKLHHSTRITSLISHEAGRKVQDMSTCNCIILNHIIGLHQDQNCLLRLAVTFQCLRQWSFTSPTTWSY